jgi:hypothetical protein
LPSLHASIIHGVSVVKCSDRSGWPEIAARVTVKSLGAVATGQITRRRLGMAMNIVGIRKDAGVAADEVPRYPLSR